MVNLTVTMTLTPDERAAVIDRLAEISLALAEMKSTRAYDLRAEEALVVERKRLLAQLAERDPPPFGKPE
jgi:hypothetical protein